MSVSLFMDVHINRAIATALRKRGVDVLLAQEDGSDTLTDSALLDRATALDRILFTHDPDLLGEAERRQRTGESFAGLVYVRFQKLSIGKMVADLELIAKTSDAIDTADRVEFLPF